MPYQIETEEREDGAPNEDIHILCTKAARVNQVHPEDLDANIPSPLDPSNNLSAQPQCVRSIQ